MGTGGRRHFTREAGHAGGDAREPGSRRDLGGGSSELLHGPGNTGALANGNNVL